MTGGRFVRSALLAAASGLAVAAAIIVAVHLLRDDAPEDGACRSIAACEELARSLERVQPLRAAEAFERACDLGAAASCTAAGAYWNHLDKLDTQDPARANALFVRACAADDQPGCIQLGVNLVEGRGGPVEGVRGAYHLRTACARGFGRGCRALALAYRDGDGMAPDPVLALAMFERGCERGDLKACDAAGAEIMSLPTATHAAQVRARGYLERTCAADPGLCYNLGVALASGAGGPRDAVAARAAYTRACTADVASACNNLAILWRDGEGGEKDLSRARELWDRACRLHLERGCQNLRRFGPS